MPEAKGKLDGTVTFHLKGEKGPVVLQSLGEGVTNKKTNAFAKPPAKACAWVALSALVALQNEAKKKGANAVVELVSFYKKREFSSATEYECHKGAVMAGVALKGQYATVERGTAAAGQL